MNGIKAIAEAIRVTASLTDLNLADNEIGGHYDDDDDGDDFIETPEAMTLLRPLRVLQQLLTLCASTPP